MIKQLFLKTYRLITNNMVLVQPLLFFFLLINLLLSPDLFKSSFNLASLFLILSICGLFCAFLAGWYNMMHKSIEYVDKFNLPPEEKAVNSLNIFKEFFPGVGKYFYKIVIGMILYLLLAFAVLFLIKIIGVKVIGIPRDVFTGIMNTPFSNHADIVAFMDKIPQAEKIKLFKWDLLGLIFFGLFTYLTMFWVQATVSDDKNPLKAYWISLKTVFKKPVMAMAIHSSQWFGIFGVCIVSSSFSMNFLIQFFMLLLLLFVVVYFTLMTFLYYERFR